jgi:hypothetical protein
VELDEQRPDATALAFCEEVARALEGRGNAGAPSQDRFRFVSERYCWQATAARYFEVIRSALAEG